MDNKPTILIVDEDSKFRKTLSDILGAKGYRVVAAAKGKTALDRVKEERPAVALIDLKLPDMDGLKMMMEIKKRSPDTECIVLTGHTSQASAIEAVNLGAYGYMQKPYDMEQLVVTIHRAIEKRRTEEALQNSKEFIETVFNSVNDAISVIDTTNFRIVGVNRGFLSTLNMEEKDVIGKHCYEVTHHRSKPCEPPDETCPLAKTLKTGKHSSAEHIHHDKDGREICVEVSTSPVRNEKGEIYQVVHVARDITEHKRAEEALKASEERYRSLLDGIPVGLYRATPQGQNLDANPAAVQMLGYPDLKSLQAANVADLYVDPRERNRWQALMEQEGVVLDFETQLRRHDGTTIWVRDSARAIRDADGRILYYEGSLEDITERKRAEEALRHRTEQLEALRQVGLELTAQLDLHALLNSIVSRAVQLLEGNAGGLYLYRPERDILEWAVSIGPNLAPIGTILRRGEGLSGKVWETGEPLIVDDYQRWEGRPAIYEGYPLTAVVGVPVRWGEEFLGVLNVLADTPRTFSPADAELLSLFASQAATAIVNARLYEEAQARSTYLATLLRINATLRGTLPLSQVLEMILQGAAEALGYVGSFIAIPDATGERLTLGAAWGGRVVDAALKITRFKLDSFSVPVKAQENIIARAFVTGELQISSGEPEGMAVGTKPPIGAKMAKVIERIAGARGAVCVPLRVAEKTMGVLIVVSPREQLADEERAMLLGLADQAGLAIENARLYEETRRKAEELAVLNEIGRAVSSVMHLDDLLELISQQASRVIDTSNLYIALYDEKKNEVSFPLYFEEGQRRRPEKRPAKHGLTEYVIHSAKPLMINRNLVSRLKELNVELIGRPSKSWLGVPILSEEQAIGVLAIQDYQKEGAYDESHLRLLSAIANQAAIAIENARLFETVVRGKKEWEETFDSVSDGVCLIDSNWTIMRTNRALAESFSTTPQELIGRKCCEVIHGFDEPWSECPLREVLETKQPIIREAENPPTGRTLQLSVYPRLDDKGNAVGSVHVVRDITERKRREEEIQRRNRELAALNAIAATVSGSLDLDEILKSALVKILEITGFESGGIGLVDRPKERIVPIAHHGVPPAFLATSVQPRAGDGLRWRAVESGEAIFFEDIPHDPRISREKKALVEEFCAAAYIPLKVKDRVVGLVGLGTRQEHHFTPEDKALLMTISNQIGVAIENAQAYQSLRDQNLQIIAALATAVEARDPYTGGHSQKVTELAIAIAEKMGLSNDEIEDLRVAGLLHDIGKIGIPDSVLNKPARLTPAEFLMVKTHSAISAEIVERIEALAPIVPIIRHHHERWDGDGYPDRLKGEDIPLLARILAVTDGFEAMTAERPYRRARTEEGAVAELEKGAGSQWDPHVVEVFANMKKGP